MTWTGAKDLKARLARLWERGELARDLLTGQARFPLRLPLKTPGSQDLRDRFDAVRAWTAELANTPQVRLEWEEVQHRVQGRQRLPAGAWVDSLDRALAWLGKRQDWERWLALVAATRAAQPRLLPWLEKRPLHALELAADWPRLLAVVGWLQQHPRPGIYLRQVDLPGVHSKFIERHRGLLTELLDLALPAEAQDASKTGAGQFAARYGFLDKPLRIRLRLLDPQLELLPGIPAPDLTLDAASFARLTLAPRRVFITENETNFLAFPPVADAVLIFGAGYGWEALAQARWLEGCPLYYWGDIDTHGFAILDQLRGVFPRTISFLMDRATLDAHQSLWGVEHQPQRAELHRLTPAEQALHEDLRAGRICPGLRLEQEMVGFGWLHDRLQELVGAEGPGHGGGGSPGIVPQGPLS